MVLQGRKSSPQKSRPPESGHRRHGVWIAIEYSYKLGQKKEFKFLCVTGWFSQIRSHIPNLLSIIYNIRLHVHFVWHVCSTLQAHTYRKFFAVVKSPQQWCVLSSQLLDRIFSLYQFILSLWIELYDSCIIQYMPWLLNKMWKNQNHKYQLPFGLVVRIPGFHPGSPGSIPGMGTFCENYPYASWQHTQRMLQFMCQKQNDCCWIIFMSCN